MLQSDQPTRNKPSAIACLSSALITIVYTCIVVVVVGFICFQGAGIRQEISEGAVSDTAFPGMSIEEFCYRLGIAPKDADANGDLVVSSIGWLSLFVAQRRIVARFDSENRLTRVHVWTEHGIGEDGRYLPLRGLPNADSPSQ